MHPRMTSNQYCQRWHDELGNHHPHPSTFNVTVREYSPFFAKPATDDTWLPSRRAMNRIKEVLVVDCPNLTQIDAWRYIAMYSIMIGAHHSHQNKVLSFKCPTNIYLRTTGSGLGLQNMYPEFLLPILYLLLKLAMLSTKRGASAQMAKMTSNILITACL